MYICAGILPLAYFIGLLFTLKTHSHIYDKIPGPEAHELEDGGTYCLEQHFVPRLQEKLFCYDPISMNQLSLSFFTLFL